MLGVILNLRVQDLCAAPLNSPVKEVTSYFWIVFKIALFFFAYPTVCSLFIAFGYLFCYCYLLWASKYVFDIANLAFNVVDKYFNRIFSSVNL